MVEQKSVSAASIPTVDEGTSQQVTVDCQRTCLQARFFSHFNFRDAGDLLTAIDHIDVDLASLYKCVDASEYVYSGWVYWFVFLKGCRQFTKNRVIGPQNIYFIYLRDYYLPRGCDLELSKGLTTEDKVIARVAYRFADFEALAARDSAATDAQFLDPTRFVVDSSGKSSLHIYQAGTPEPVIAGLVDGWHRLFGARLFGWQTAPGELVSDGTYF